MPVPKGSIAGGGLLPSGKLLTWGTDLLEWNLESRTSRKAASGPYRSGCVSPDGAVVALQLPNGNLIVRRGPRWTRSEFVDKNVEMSDCLWTTLLGQPGLLLIHRHAQVRHYHLQPPEPAAHRKKLQRWPYREIYSIYTASRQTGLAVHDVDADGNPDILVGNYWIRSPRSSDPNAYDLPWRLFAFNAYYSEPDSSTVSLAPVWGGIVVGQREHVPSLFSWFTPESDITQLWRETAISGWLTRPRALLAVGSELLVGEDNGDSSRVYLLHKNLRFGPEVIQSNGVLQLIGRRLGFVLLERQAVRLFESPP